MMATVGANIQLNFVKQQKHNFSLMSTRDIDTDVPYSSNWFKGWLEPRINQTAFTKNTLFILTWDEALTSSPTNQIYTVLFGDVIQVAEGSDRTDDTPYDHYSLLRSIEDNVSLNCIS